MWVKIDVCVMSDPDLLECGPLGWQVWVFVLCQAKLHGRAGVFAVKYLRPSNVMRSCGFRSDQTADVKEALEVLQKIGLLEIEEGEARIPSWKDHQSDPTAADRKRRSRDRKAAENGDSSRNVTRDKVASRSVTDVTLERRGEETRAEEKRTHQNKPSPPAPKYDWDGMLESYNRIAKSRSDLAVARSWTPKRKKAAQLRLKGSDAEEGWDEFIGALEVSDFSWWKSTTPGLDWFLKPENWAKTTEGNYTSRDSRPAPLKDYNRMFPAPSKPPPVVDLFPDDEPF